MKKCGILCGTIFGVECLCLENTFIIKCECSLNEEGNSSTLKFDDM